MADTFGALAYPAQLPALEDALADPTLDKLSAYLAAVINSNLGSAWNQRQQRTPPVNSVQLNNPEVCAINDRDLPGLFVWRQTMRGVREADEWHADHSEIHALWIPNTVPQAQLAQLIPFFNGVSKVIFRAIILGRDPAWVDPGDTDPQARALGSLITEACGLLYPPEITSAAPYTAKVQAGTETRKYPAVLAKIKTVESTYWDPSKRGVTASHTTTTTVGGVTLDTLQDPPV